MRILVIGGTVFVGRHVVTAALARGHDVTIFHRGAHGEHVLPPEVTHLHGDRSDPVPLHGSGAWDAVVDTCGFTAADIEPVVRALGDAAGHYSFVSSISVYRDWPARAERTVFDPDAEPSYGADKARAERVVTRAYGDRALVTRPGLIVGPHENIGRLPFWLRRIARGGDVLAPGSPDEPRQWLDARDYAEWLLDCAERAVAGTYDVVSPPGAFTMADLLDACVDVTGSDAVLRWTPGERVAAAGIESWSELPLWLWLDGDLAAAANGWSLDASAAAAAGFRSRPVRDTVADTWAWLRAGGELSGYRAERAVRDLDPAKERGALG